MNISGVEDEVERLDHLILAAENWADGYAKSPDTHAKLIKADARLERKLRGFFRDLADKAPNMVNWSAYRTAIQAYSLDVIFNDDVLDSSRGEFINIVFDDIAVMTALGSQAGETIYKIALGITSSDAVIQDIARNHVAELVGMKIDKDGQLVINPRAEYSITDTIRDDIRSSIQTSIALGEDIQTASDRLSNVIDNPKRAEVIARTESVNSYGQGLLEFGKQSNAVGKEWQDNGAVDVCADNSDAGVIPIDDTFPSGDDAPAAHPNCRCTVRLVYQNEMDE